MNRKRPFPSRPTAVSLVAAAGSAAPAWAETATAATDAPPAEIAVWGRAFDLVGTAQSGSQGVVGYAISRTARFRAPASCSK